MKKILMSLLLVSKLCSGQVCQDSLEIVPNLGNRLVVVDKQGKIFQDWLDNKCFIMNYYPVPKQLCFTASSIYKKDTTYITKYMFAENQQIISLMGVVINNIEQNEYRWALNPIYLNSYVFFIQPYQTYTILDYINARKNIENFTKLVYSIYPNF